MLEPTTPVAAAPAAAPAVAPSTDIPDTFTFSATECIIEAGSTYEVPVPLTDHPDGCFLIYKWNEKVGGATHFTVHTDAGRMLLDEVNHQSNGRLHVSQASRLTLRWDNSSAWLNALTVAYEVKVVSDRGVQNTLRARLLHASRAGPLSLVEQCLDRGVPVESVDDSGYTPLMLAVLSQQRATAELLLSRGAATSASDRRGNTPLHLASLQRAPAVVVQLLLEAKAEALARNEEGMAAAHIAAFTGGAEALGLLLAASPGSADSRDAHGNTPLHLAASAGHASVLAALLEPAGARAAGRNARGDSPLSCAVGAGHTEVVAALLAAGALDPPTEAEAAAAQAQAMANGGGGEAAAVAAGDELARCVTRAAAGARREAATHREIALLLLGFGEAEADGAACVRGLRAAPPTSLGGLLVAACGAGAKLPVLRLLQADASPDSAAGGRTALSAAAEHGHAATVSLLMRRGAVVAEGAAAGAAGGGGGGTAVGSVAGGEGAMAAAVRAGHTPAVRALVGAHHEGREGRDALLLAAAAGRTGMALVLLESGVPIDARDERGRGALHHAAASGHTMTALALLRKGCSPAALDDDGTSAAHAAVLAGYKETALAMLRAAPPDDALALLSSSSPAKSV